MKMSDIIISERERFSDITGTEAYENYKQFVNAKSALKDVLKSKYCEVSEDGKTEGYYEVIIEG